MEYIPITDSKLKIICEEEDLALYGLSADSLEYGDEAGRHFIEDILDKAQKKLGFESKHHRILVQIFPSIDGGCEIFISRLGLLAEEKSLCQKEKSDSKKALCQKLFFFDKLDFLLEVCKRLALINSELKSDAFYLDGKGYYLMIEMNTDLLEEYGLFSLDEYSFILEFGTSEDIQERAPYLYEYAKQICKGNAIKTLSRL